MLEQLPATLLQLTEVIDGLVPAAAGATETVAAANRVTARLEALLDDIEDPIRRMIPAIERVAASLDDPAVDAIPDTLERIRAVVVPLSDAFARSSSRAAAVRQEASRIATGVRSWRRPPPETGQESRSTRRPRRSPPRDSA